MIKVYLSINDNSEVLLLPVTPSEYEIKESWDNKQIDGLYQSLNIVTKKGLSTIDLESFFPVKEYPFALNKTMYGSDYVDTIKRWWDLRIPIRLIIVNTDPSIKLDTVNMLVTIDSFTHRTATDGDIYYTLALKEFLLVVV
ncbi:hypothetical protein [Desulfosporosinus nitroreducens]|uniref:hypothetical protein n=1 Tax=Desulfosporosinus nitroreducens TaxID=2018668 RepID=UPI00207C8F40|nr:hypothetical protein [Desulfosporosinus nitroreducens]MCO1599822.1 hypothetical protein [Desulfosporosinus nitroreducens]